MASLDIGDNTRTKIERISVGHKTPPGQVRHQSIKKRGIHRFLFSIRRSRGGGRRLGSGARTPKTVAQPEYEERHAQSQRDLIRTLKLLGIPALQESANFHRNLKRDDFGKVLHKAADIMTIDEVADYLRINKKTAYCLAADSKLSGLKVGGAWRLRRVDIDDWIEREASPKKDKKR